MKRKITVRAPGIRVVAVITTTQADELKRDEVEEIRDQLADRLQEAVAGLANFRTPRNRVHVS